MCVCLGNYRALNYRKFRGRITSEHQLTQIFPHCMMGWKEAFSYSFLYVFIVITPETFQIYNMIHQMFLGKLWSFITTMTRMKRVHLVCCLHSLHSQHQKYSFLEGFCCSKVMQINSFNLPIKYSEICEFKITSIRRLLVGDTEIVFHVLPAA